MFAIAGVATSAVVMPIAVKAVGELHRVTVLRSNTLARQGESLPERRGEEKRLARQRAAGLKGGNEVKPPSYMGKVPSKATKGDLRREYEIGGLGEATSSKGNIIDILSRVPRRTVGTDDYKRIARPTPSRAPGFGNQSFTP